MIMKKIVFLILAVGTLGLTSCNTKSCRCYEYVGSRWTGPVTTSALAGTPCGNLNNPSLYCNEMDDPIIDPSDIANGKKK